MSTEVSYSPGPRGLPVIDNTADSSRGIFAFFEELRDEYGHVARYEVFGTDVCLVAHRGAIHQVSLDHHEAFERGEG
ncbi:hypothetical protein VB779_14170 [Haloarculaceae archaeon H-GB11]|nr:hypothetical protein [Haloarculaceae archaeon H-GB11]